MFIYQLKEVLAYINIRKFTEKAEGKPESLSFPMLSFFFFFFFFIYIISTISKSLIRTIFLSIAVVGVAVFRNFMVYHLVLVF